MIPLPVSAAWPLAHSPELGCIFRCPDCTSIHLVLGPVNLQVSPEAFLEIVDLFSRAAANFELMLDADQGASCA